MISNQKNNTLLFELKELNYYMNKDKNKVFEISVNNRLKKSLAEYYSRLSKSLENLVYKEDDLKVMNHINKDK